MPPKKTSSTSEGKGKEKESDPSTSATTTTNPTESTTTTNNDTPNPPTTRRVVRGGVSSSSKSSLSSLKASRFTPPTNSSSNEGSSSSNAATSTSTKPAGSKLKFSVSKNAKQKAAEDAAKGKELLEKQAAFEERKATRGGRGGSRGGGRGRGRGRGRDEPLTMEAIASRGGRIGPIGAGEARSGFGSGYHHKYVDTSVTLRHGEALQSFQDAEDEKIFKRSKGKEKDTGGVGSKHAYSSSESESESESEDEDDLRSHASWLSSVKFEGREGSFDEGGLSSRASSVVSLSRAQKPVSLDSIGESRRRAAKKGKSRGTKKDATSEMEGVEMSESSGVTSASGGVVPMPVDEADEQARKAQAHGEMTTATGATAMDIDEELKRLVKNERRGSVSEGDQDTGRTKIEVSQLRKFGQMAELMQDQIANEPPKLFFFQLPLKLPKAAPPTPTTNPTTPIDVDMLSPNKDESSSSTIKQESQQDPHVSVTTPVNTAFGQDGSGAKRDWKDLGGWEQEGIVGKLKFYKSGKVKLDVNGILFDITPSTPVSFLQHVYSIDPATKTAYTLGQLGEYVRPTKPKTDVEEELAQAYADVYHSVAKSGFFKCRRFVGVPGDI